MSDGRAAEPETLVELLQWRAQERPAGHAYTFLADGELDARPITYGELDRRARALAASLQERSRPGERALIVLPPGLDYIAAFFACLYAGLIAVPVPLPQRRRGLPRLISIVRDCRPSIALTNDALLATVGKGGLDPTMADLESLGWIAIDQLPGGLEDRWRPPRLEEGSLAFLQYTSGSTGTPKGVALTHGNLLRNERMIQRAFGQTESSVIVGWLPPYHDMGLIGNILQPLYLGAPCIQMAPQHFLMRPLRWLTAIARYRATTSGGPNFAYDLCVDKIGVEQRAGLDLGSWTVAFNGAEPVRAKTLDRFAEAFAGAGFKRSAFRPCYGLAEATLLVSGGARENSQPVVRGVERKALEQGRAVFVARDGGAEVRLVGCGRPQDGAEVLMVDPETCRPCADGQVGEIWVEGATVAQGYWERPDETAWTFGARLETGEGPFLRTGDLGFLDDGDLYVTGRLKDLVIIRGRNLYPQDIELTVETHGSSGGAAAFSVDVEGEERLVVVQEAGERGGAELAERATAIREAIADRHEVAVHAMLFIRRGSLPRTTSGKVQRRACRERFLEGALEVVWPLQPETGATEGTGGPPLTPLETLLADIWAEVLGCKRVGRDDEFLSLGGDSLRAMQVSARIREACGVAAGPAQLFETTTVAALAAWIEDRRADGDRDSFAAPTSAVRPEHLPLSLVQERLWLLDQLVEGAPVYHIAAALRFTGHLDAQVLERSVTALVARHEALRTTFPLIGGRPVQNVGAPAAVKVPFLDLGDQSAETRGPTLHEHLTAAARRPFDLAAAPPVRFSLVRTDGREHVLAFTCHHIVADGWSMAVLLRELVILYRAFSAGKTPALPPLALQYADHAIGQRERDRAHAHEKELAYWRDRLKGATGPLVLLTDRPRPPAQTYAGARFEFVLPPVLMERLGALGRREGVTLFTTVAAALVALLYRYTGQTDLCIGTPVTMRPQVALEGVVGCFINTLALRVDVSGEPTVAELLARVRATIAGAQEHRNVPFERVVEALGLPRAASHSPLFQVMLAMDPPLGVDAEVVPGLSMAVERVDTGTTQFDLTLGLTAHAHGARGAWEYNTDLFDRATITRMTGHLLSLLEGLTGAPQSRLADLPLMGTLERKELGQWNATERAYPSDRLVHELIEAQVEQRPEDVALIFEERRLTYRELDAQSNQVAHALRRLGVGPDVLVAIAAERSVEIVVGLLGIMKAGGAYVPIDPEYPAERIAFMLEDAGAPVLVSHGPVSARLPVHRARLLCLDADRDAIEREPRWTPAVHLAPENLAYTIYTSGSTGRPKGAGNTHRGLLNRLQWMQERFGLTGSDRVLQKTPFSFDVSVWEFFWPLMTGATLVVARPGDHRNGERLVELITRHGITTLHFVPPMLQAFLETPGVDACRALSRVICSGEALPAELARRFFERLGAELHNLYGPTEASIDVTAWQCRPEDALASVPIGRPIANTQIHLLDRHGQPVPVGVAGELHIGGVGLARGYHGRPALTAERFVPDPFGGVAGARLYRTGDLARYRPDGAIEFLGRLDHQVKIRGLRVELGEIEARLLQHPAVGEAVVVAREEARGGKRLVAYVSPRPGAESGLRVEGLRAWVAETLPAHMVPAPVVVLDRLPLSPNGKVDRRALPSPDERPEERANVAAPPRTELERTVAAAWQEVLPVASVGIHDNFFDLGGHSLLLTQVHGRLRERLGRPIAMLLLFQHPTIASLAAALGGGAGPAAAPGDEERRREREASAQQRRAEMFARRRRTEESSK